LETIGACGAENTKRSLSSDQVRESKVGKFSGSDFVASLNNPFFGLGIVSHCPFFDPTNVLEDSAPSKLYDLFHKFDADVNTTESFAQKLSACVVVYNDLSKIHETTRGVGTSNVGRNLSVQENHLNKIQLLFHGFKTSTRSNAIGTLSNLGCGLGIATGASIPDGFIVDEKNIPRVIWWRMGPLPLQTQCAKELLKPRILLSTT
jgi:hypothetical protein